MAKRNTNQDEFRQYDNYTWRDHADIREELGALKEAGKNRDQQIKEIKESVEKLGSQVSDLRSDINSFKNTVKTLAWVVGALIAIAGACSKFL